MTRSPMQSWSTLVRLVIVAAVCTGCEKGDERVAVKPDTTLVTRLTAAEHDTIVREADSLYDFEAERDTVVANDPAFPGPVVDDGSLPRMTIATARLKPNASRPTHRIIARIRSAGPYANMGIQPGDNFVWRSSWNDADTASWVTRVIPRDSATAHNLVRDARNQEYTHGMSAKEPRLVVLKVHSVSLALCVDDPRCPTGHCGYY